MTTLYFWILFTGILIVIGLYGLVNGIAIAKDYCIPSVIIGAISLLTSSVIFIVLLCDTSNNTPSELINPIWWSIYIFPGLYFIHVVILTLNNYTYIFNIDDWYIKRYNTAIDDLQKEKIKNKKLESELELLKEQNKQETNRLKKKFFLRRMPTYIKLHII